MGFRNTIAKLYVRLVFRDEGEFNAYKTQLDFNYPDPPKGIAKRAERVESSNVRAFWIDKTNAGNGVLVYLHGGAFYFGPVKEHWQYLARICKMTEMAGVMVDYGIAPQNPFPQGLNEIVEFVSNLDGQNWFFLGDSSGAAMAFSACFKLREMGRSLPQKLVLMSPWIDAALQNPDIDLNKHEDPMMTVERLSNAANAYAADADLRDPMISPMFGDLAGLPPTLIQMGTSDLLLADCRKFVEKCRQAGLDVRYDEFPDCFHDFMMLSFLPEAKQALRSQAEFLLDENGDEVFRA
jgi:epsilon-lactone hydrolase